MLWAMRKLPVVPRPSASGRASFPNAFLLLRIGASATCYPSGKPKARPLCTVIYRETWIHPTPEVAGGVDDPAALRKRRLERISAHRDSPLPVH